MMVSNPHGLFYDLCKRINRRQLRGAFGALRARHWRNLLDLPHGTCLLVLANHHTWWDEQLLLELFGQALDYDSFWMTDLGRLKKHPGLIRIGAFSIDPRSSEECRQSVQHVADLLQRPQRVVGLFPQIRPAVDGAPLVFQEKVCELLFQQEYAPHIQVLNVATCCGFWAGKKPEWFVQIGCPTPLADLRRDGKLTPAAMQSALTELHQDLKTVVTRGQADEFSLLWRGLQWCGCGCCKPSC